MADLAQLHSFNFSDEQIKKFKTLNAKIKISIDHSLYKHVAIISQNNKEALIKDFI